MAIKKPAGVAKSKNQASLKLIDSDSVAIEKPSLKSELPDIHSNIQKIFRAMNEKITGQENAKQVLATGIAIHLDKVRRGSLEDKSNILIHGATGTGKTAIVKAAIKNLNCNLYTIDCSKLSPTSFKGSSVTDFMQNLFESVGSDKERAETSIIFLDEIDKLCRGSSESEVNDHTSKIQAELLALVQGQEIPITVSSLPGMKSSISLDTSRMLFIAAGAFSGLEKYVNKPSRPIVGIRGSLSDSGPCIDTHDDFNNAMFKYGMMPELLGRFQLVTSTHKLSEDQYLNFFQNDAIIEIVKYYQQAFEQVGSSLEVSKEFLSKIAEKSAKSPLGARGAKGILEKKLMELLFNVEKFKGKTVELTADGHQVLENPANEKRNIGDEIRNFLTSSSIFSGLPDEAITEIIVSSRVRKFKNDEFLMKEDSAPDSLMILMTGSVRARNSDGLSAVRSRIGTCFGEISFLQNSKRTADIIAIGDVVVIEFDNNVIRKFIADNPDVGVKLVTVFSNIAIKRYQN